MTPHRTSSGTEMTGEPDSLMDETSRSLGSYGHMAMHEWTVGCVKTLRKPRHAHLPSLIYASAQLKTRCLDHSFVHG